MFSISLISIAALHCPKYRLQ